MYLQLALAPLLAAAVANAAEILSTSSNAQVVPNGYIVVLNDDVNAEAFDSHQAWVTNVHRASLRSVAVPLTASSTPTTSPPASRDMLVPSTRPPSTRLPPVMMYRGFPAT